jgi:hypothetical protein
MVGGRRAPAGMRRTGRKVSRRVLDSARVRRQIPSVIGTKPWLTANSREAIQVLAAQFDSRYTSVHQATGGVDLLNTSLAMRTALANASQLMLESVYYQSSYVVIAEAPTSWRLIMCVLPFELATGPLLTNEQLFARPGCRVIVGNTNSVAATVMLRGNAYTSTSLTVSKVTPQANLTAVVGQGLPTLYMRFVAYEAPALCRVETTIKSKWLATGLPFMLN